MNSPDAVENTLTYFVRALVDDPGSVSVDVSGAGSATNYDIYVARGDLGRVIGRQGRVAAALRLVARAVATKDDRRVSVDIRD